MDELLKEYGEEAVGRYLLKVTAYAEKEGIELKKPAVLVKKWLEEDKVAKLGESEGSADGSRKVVLVCGCHAPGEFVVTVSSPKSRKHYGYLENGESDPEVFPNIAHCKLFGSGMNPAPPLRADGM